MVEEFSPHTPVLLREVVEALSPHAGGVYVDGTFGAGGYSKAILEAAPCRLFAFDRDPDVVPRAEALKARFGEMFCFIQARFGDMEACLKDRNVFQVDGIGMDVGVSSMHLNDPARGFSLAKDGPLDMTMSRTSPNAADLVNEADPQKLERIIRLFGEERHARRIARAIATRRERAPILRTLDLAALIESVVPKKPHQRIHPATKTFQALRIYINDELEELWRALNAAERLLKPAGRLAIVVFHSLEDRIVKQFLAERAEPKKRPSRHIPFADKAENGTLTFKYLPIRMQTPSDEEIASNPRARSAKLRCAERTAAPPWSHESGGEHTSINLWWRDVA